MPTLKLKKQDHIKLIKYAILHFKLAFAVPVRKNRDKNNFDYLGKFTWGKHIVSSKDLKLTPKQEDFALSLFEHTATYTLALQIDTAFENLFPNRFANSCEAIRHAAIMARLIRNSFAHNPFAPIWLISKDLRNSKSAINKIISLDTTNLHGKPVSGWDYGGPLALLLFAKFSLKLISKFA